MQPKETKVKVVPKVASTHRNGRAWDQKRVQEVNAESQEQQHNQHEEAKKDFKPRRMQAPG